MTHDPLVAGRQRTGPPDPAPPPQAPVLPANLPGQAPLVPTVPSQDLAVGQGPPAPFVLQAGRFVEVPGGTGPQWLAEGGPVEPATLVALLWLALHDEARDPLAQLLTEPMSKLSVEEVFRLGDKPSWVAARELWERHGLSLLGSLRWALSDTEFGQIRPYLRGVVSTEELVKTWEGVWSSDVAGVIRELQRMPDAEVLGMISDYRRAGAIAGTANSMVTTVDNMMRSEDDGGYRALRALVARIERVSGATGPELTPDDRHAARDLASELRVKAAFLRIREADRRRSPDLAFLAVTELSPVEKYWLDSQYVRSWTPVHFGSGQLNQLQILMNSNDDVGVIMRALDLSAERARQRDSAENAVGVQVAAEALGPALQRLAARSRDPSLSDTDREDARNQLTGLAESPETVRRILGLPDGERLLRQGLGLSRAQVARHRILQVTTSTQLMDVLRGLHGFNVSAILDAPDVKEHLEREELQVTPQMLRVLDAYASVEGAQPQLDTFIPGGGRLMIDLPALDDIDLADDAQPGGFQLVVAADPDAPDPTVVVAAYQAFRAAKDDNLAGVVAAVRPLRGSQRAALQDEAYFSAALAKLRQSRWDDTSRKIADLVADPAADLADAAQLLVAAGLMGELPYAYDVADAGLLAEGLAVPDADRRLLRYHYTLQALEEEDRGAGVSGWFAQRAALSARGVPADLDIGSDLRGAYEDRMYAVDRLEAVPQLRAQEVFLGEPEIMREDISPQEAALEAQFMRLRIEKQLAAAAQGIDASGVFGWSPETVQELSTEFRQTFERLGGDGVWTHPELVQLAAAYYDVLDSIDRNRQERDAAAQFVGQLAAVVAGLVVVIATAGTGTPLVVAMLAAAGVGAGASMAVTSQFRDYTSPDQALQDAAHGAVTGALTVAGEVLAAPVGAMVGRQMARFAARSAVNRAVAGAARLSVEGAIDGAIGGAGDAVFATAIDKRTWEREVTAIFARFLSAAARGAFWGGVTGAVAAPVLGGAIKGASRLLRAAGRGVDDVAADALTGLDRVAAHADQGRFDLALRHMDELNLTGAQRDALTQELFRRALGSRADGAAIPEHMLRELENARQLTRNLDQQAGPPRPGERMPLDVTPIEDLLRRLESQLGAAEVTHVRKIIYGEIRLAPEELIIKQHAFERGLQTALDELTTPAQRLALPPYEVRVLPPEAFEGMLRSPQGRAVTLLEGQRAVVYVRADANVRTHMLQEAAHLAQLGDPQLAEGMRLLSERNVLDWADKAAEDRLHLHDVSRRLEIDAQERIIKALDRELPYAGDPTAASDELTHARQRLAQLQAQEVQARSITPEQLSEMNAGIRARPDWMQGEPRLFGHEIVEGRPSATAVQAAEAVPVKNSTAPRHRSQSAFRLGDEWLKQTYVTSGIDGTVESIEIVDGATVVSVKPDGGDSRPYVIDAGGALEGALKAGDQVIRGQRLGSWTQQYRLIEVRHGNTALRRVEEVFDRKSRWVERGSSRTTRGDILEEAAELQVSAQLRRAAGARRTPSTMRDWFIVRKGKERWGFDRVFVEFYGDGANTTAVIRVLEVKDYPNSYVPYAEFTAITDNWATNVTDLNTALSTHVDRLTKEGKLDAARALQQAIDDTNIQVELWLGPTTKMGTDENAARSVLARLRETIDDQPGNVRLVTGGPRKVSSASQKAAIEARKAGKAAGTP